MQASDPKIRVRVRVRVRFGSGLGLDLSSWLGLWLSPEFSGTSLVSLRPS